MESWGWRIPFLLGGILGPVGMWMRRTIDETPAYRARRCGRAGRAGRRRHRADLLAARAFGFTILWTVSFYIFLTYMPTFTQKYAKVERAGGAVVEHDRPARARDCDSDHRASVRQIGRKPLLLACCIAFIVLPYPVFALLLGAASLVTILLIQLSVGLTIALFSGAGPAAISEIFPTRDALDLDDDRLCAVGRDLRRLRAVHRDLADRQDRLADLAGLLCHRGGGRVGRSSSRG